MLMCCACWSKVPSAIQADVYRTVKLRGPSCDKTWAPWWRAQARAIDAVMRHDYPGHDAAQDAYLRRELAFADKLEQRS
jgi:hypothetical protein